ncbi:MAG: 50S ribosomal protein L10 [Candidatus ainarchaeum sp.]|nr:50S ribosomal protein L10 [Candidatus ainarchaeum sp.]
MAYKVDTKRKAVKEKIEQVNDAIGDMKKYKTVALLDLRKLPTALFQSLRKKIREDGGRVLVLKKPVISRVLAANAKLKSHVADCDKPVALIYTNHSPYEINTFFKQHRKKRAAKVGDIATADIIVPEGETDLPPGPALSELKAGGLNVQIKAGKIAVTKESTVAKAGEKLTAPKVKALQTLGVMPFEMMANMITASDGEYSYSKELLDMGDTIVPDLSMSLSQAVNFSINTGYPTSQNIGMLLGGAFRQSVSLALNAGVYSSSSIEQLLTSALRQGMALEGAEKK